jgi:hypothetical protein
MLMNTLRAGFICFRSVVSVKREVGVSESIGITSYISGVMNAKAKFK